MPRYVDEAMTCETRLLLLAESHETLQRRWWYATFLRHANSDGLSTVEECAGPSGQGQVGTILGIVVKSVNENATWTALPPKKT